MRLNEVRARNFSTAFRDEIHIDLRPLSGLCAVVGPNGAGKSTLCGIMGGAVHRKMPDGQRIDDLAQDRDSFIEANYTNGQTFTIRQDMDAISGKGDAVAIGEDDVPLCESGKNNVKRWVADHVPSSDVLYASIFGKQDSRGFIDLKPSPRISVIMQALGHEGLKATLTSVRKEATATSAKLDTCVARLADAKESAGDVAALKNAAMVATQALEAAQKADDHAQFCHAAATSKLTQRHSEEAARATAVAEREGHKKRIAALNSEIAELEERIANNAMVIENADEIRKAAARTEAIDVERNTKLQALAQSKTARAEADAKVRADVANAKRYAEEREKVASEIEALTKRIDAERPTVEAAERSLPTCIATENEAMGRLDHLRADLAKLEQQRLTGKDARITGLRDGLKAVEDHNDAANEIAGRTLRADDAMEGELDGLPDRILSLQLEIGAAQKDANAAIDARQQAEQDASRRTVLDEWSATLLAKTKAKVDAAENLADTHAALANHTALREEHDRAIAATQASIDALEEERASLALMAGRLAPLAQAETRLEELNRQLGEKRKALKVATAERGAVTVPQLTATETTEALATAEANARAEADAARSALEAARLAGARAQDAVTRAEEAKKRIATLTAERATLEEDLADWRLLEQGIDTVMLLELDAAAPKLTDFANDLLFNCLGTRFSVRFETAVAKKDGSGDKDGCWVFVLDSETGKERDAKFFSGGERSLVAEAVDLAIAMLGCEHAGMEEPTIVRDETAGLDEENGPAYIAMLRRAAEVVGSPLVLFITHSKTLEEMADHRIEVGNGTARVAA